MNDDLSIASKETSGILLIIGLVTILLVHIFFLLPFPITCGVTALYVLVIFFLHRPLEGFFALLVIRASVDFLDTYFSVSLSETITLNVAAILGLLLIAMTCVLALTHRKDLFRRPLVVSFGLFIIFSAGSIFYSIDQGATFEETSRIISIFAAFLGTHILCIRVPHARKTLITATLFAAILPLTFAIFQLASGTGYSDNTGTEGRLFGTFKHPNSFASFLLVVIALLTYRVFETLSQRYNRNTALTLLGVTVTILLLTFSRGGWFAFLIFFGLFGLLRAPKVIFVIIAIAVTFFFTSQTVHDRIEDIYNPPADSSIRWRIQQWKNAVAAWQLSPIYGYGAGTEIAIFEKEQGYYAGNPYTHNDIIKVLQETGIIGTGLFLLLLGVTCIRLIKTYHATQNASERLFVLIILLLFIAQIGFGMSSNIWRGTAVQWFLWALIACALSYNAPRKNSHQLHKN
ncbi:MAG: O-antigen ligase family protein [Parcubacteria group bacterium]|jgi:O-antigen ligase